MLGPEHPDTAASLNNLALLLRTRATLRGRGRSTSAHWRYAKRRSAPSIPIRRRASTTSPSCSQTRATLQGRGRSTSARWRYAKRCSAPSIPIRRRASTTSPSCSRTRATLRGRGRSSSARWQSTKRCSAPSIPIRRRASTTSPACSRTRATLAAARPLYERALAIREKVLGPEHPDTATSLNNLAILLQSQGDFAAARPLYRARAGDPRKGARPRASRYGRRASTTSLPAPGQGDFAGARPLYERALAICEKALGPEHPNTNRARCNLSRLLLATGQPTEALGRRAKPRSPPTTRLLDETTPGPRTAPASLPTRSTRLAAPRRRRRCGSGMGSRPLRSPSPHKPLMLIAVTALAGRVAGIHSCRSLLECHLPAAELFHRPRPGSGPCFPRLCFERDADLANHRTPID